MTEEREIFLRALDAADRLAGDRKIRCPFCGSDQVDAEFVDVGVGGSGMQVTPYHCLDCDAEQMNPDADRQNADADESAAGWWKGPLG